MSEVVLFSRFHCKVSLLVPAFKNVGKRSVAKIYHPVSLLSVISKVFENLLNSSSVNHLKKMFSFF